jgi:hypothetical protein
MPIILGGYTSHLSKHGFPSYFGILQIRSDVIILNETKYFIGN